MTRATIIEGTEKSCEDAIYFWMPDEEFGFFSQWYPKTFHVDGQRYYTAEHWMMATKAKFFGDMQTYKMILDEPEPEKVRDLGRLIKPFDSKVWAQHSFEVVLSGNRVKFQDSDLKERMLATGDRLLVEASPTDRLWGIGYDAAHAADHFDEWGQNLMGTVMMQIRAELRGQTCHI